MKLKLTFKIFNLNHWFFYYMRNSPRFQFGESISHIEYIQHHSHRRGISHTNRQVWTWPPTVLICIDHGTLYQKAYLQPRIHSTKYNNTKLVDLGATKLRPPLCCVYMPENVIILGLYINIKTSQIQGRWKHNILILTLLEFLEIIVSF